LDGFHANYASFADNREEFGPHDLPLAVFDEDMRVNARGFFLCARHALPPLMARGGGAILFTSSGSAHAGQPSRVAYSMSKAAGHALTRHIAAKYGPKGIRANSIAPGVIIHDNWPAMTLK